MSPLWPKHSPHFSLYILCILIEHQFPNLQLWAMESQLSIPTAVFFRNWISTILGFCHQFFWVVNGFGNQTSKNFTNNSFCSRFLAGNKPKNEWACSWNFFLNAPTFISRNFWKWKLKLDKRLLLKHRMVQKFKLPTVATFLSAEIAFWGVYHYWGV